MIEVCSAFGLMFDELFGDLVFVRQRYASAACGTLY